MYYRLECNNTQHGYAAIGRRGMMLAIDGRFPPFQRKPDDIA
jgi:hypothetical protein